MEASPDALRLQLLYQRNSSFQINNGSYYLGDWPNAAGNQSEVSPQAL